MNSMARKISRTMVSGSGIAEIANRTLPQAVSLDHTLKFGVTCYETGMIEVLRGIADEDLEYGVGNTPETPEMVKFQKIVDEKSDVFRKNLDEDANLLFDELEKAFHDSSLAEVRENYIQGFIRGYRYLKNQMEYRGGSI